MTATLFARLCVTTLLLSLGRTVPAQDVKGSTDHPMFSRLPGSVITGYAMTPFEEYYLAIKKQSTVPKPETRQRLEGKITDILYTNTPGRSTLEIISSYKEALTKGGFKPIFECKGLDCGYTMILTGRFSMIADNDNARYIAAKLTRPSGDVYVSVLATLSQQQNRIRLTVIEPRAMETGLVTFTPQAMGDDIRTTGRAVLYGVLFDTDKTEPTVASASTIASIAQLLQKEPALKLLVVGHTDKVGTYEYNVNLSQRRADAVVRQLVSQYQINANRLRAVGVGYAAPVATNQTDEGKAKNRRVELVEQ